MAPMVMPISSLRFRRCSALPMYFNGVPHSSGCGRSTRLHALARAVP
jgi:hypothetical protein